MSFCFFMQGEKERKWHLAGGMWVWSVGSDWFGVWLVFQVREGRFVAWGNGVAALVWFWKRGGCGFVAGCWGEEENQRGGAGGLCKQGKGGLQPPLLSLVFLLNRKGGAPLLQKKIGLGLGFCFVFFWCFKIAHLFECVEGTSIYRKKYC
jgi:hypothetical protein